MSPCDRCRRDARPPPSRRYVTLRGTREDALEHLPRLCPAERLELSAGRISLVCEESRVDVHVVAETGRDGTGDEVPLVLLALAFEGRTGREAERFVERLRRRARPVAGHH